MKFYLKINDDWVAPDFNTDDDIGIQLYWTFDNLENPTNYTGEYSYDFTLPFTKKNKELFKNFQQMDSITSTTSTQVFHPNVLIPYIIHTTNDVISTGEAYMSEINEKGYVLNLQGSLCTAFTKLLNSGWSTTKKADDEDYFLFEDINETLDRNLIYRMWNNDTPNFNLDPTFTDITEVLTAIPMHQGRYNDFDSKSRVWYNSSLDMYSEAEIASEVDSDGLNEWQMQEYRSYEQNFGIYVQKLFAIYKNRCQEICGYDLILDNRWFNDTYEYLQNMVYTLGKIKVATPYIYNNISDESTNTWYMPDRNYSSSYTLAGISSHVSTYTMSSFPVISDEVVNYEFEVQMNAYFPQVITNGSPLMCNWMNPFMYNVDFKDENNNVIENYQFAIFMLPDATNSSTGNYLVADTEVTPYIPAGMEYKIIRYTYLPANADPGLHIFHNVNYSFVSHYNGTVTPVISWHYHDDYIPFLSTLSPSNILTYLYYYYPAYDQIRLVTTCNGIVNTENNLRSYQTFSFEKVFGDVSPFEVLLKYTKLLGMLWIVDDFDKTITITRRSDYFWDLVNLPGEYNGFKNITDLVDFNSFKIIPLAWDTRKVEFNYDDCEEEYMKRYQDTYNRTYGSALILTENYLNKDTKNLLCQSEYDTINPSCIVQPYYTPFKYYIDNALGRLKCNPAPTNQTENGEYANVINNFYFRLANVALPINMHKGGYRQDYRGTYAYISDDIDYEIKTKKYMWHSNNVSEINDKVIRKIPNYSTVRNGYGLQFSAPYELYFTIPQSLRPGDSTDTPDIQYVYDLEYAKYVTEVYNVNNKTLEVNVAINGELYRRLKMVPLVIIEDVGYLVTEIEGWNEYNKTTKLKLRQIWNYESLVYNNHSGPYTPTFSKNTIDGSNPEVTPANSPVIIEDETDIAFPISEVTNPDNYVGVAPIDPIPV